MNTRHTAYKNFPRPIKEVTCDNCGKRGNWPAGDLYQGFPHLCPECKPHKDEFLTAYTQHAQFGV